MIFTFVFVERNAVTVAVQIKKTCVKTTKDVVMVCCISRKRGKCTKNTKTTYDVTGQWYGLGACKHCNICFIDDNPQK